jgi:hypothetical protein
MTGWMFLQIGFYYNERNVLLFGLFLVIINLWFIRTQFMITQ